MSFYKMADGRVYRYDDYAPSGVDWKKLTKKDGEVAIREQAREDLRKIFKPGDTAHVILRHVSRSGMMRHLSVVTGDSTNVTYLVATACGFAQTRDGYLKVGGCGMDMGFHTIYSLGRALWPNGFKLAENQHGRNGDDTGFDNDGGYALRHSWL